MIYGTTFFLYLARARTFPLDRAPFLAYLALCSRRTCGVTPGARDFLLFAALCAEGTIVFAAKLKPPTDFSYFVDERRRRASLCSLALNYPEAFRFISLAVSTVRVARHFFSARDPSRFSARLPPDDTVVDDENERPRVINRDTAGLFAN